MPTAIDLDETLGQRSILRNLSNTSYMNDDEAERVQRRRTLGKSPAANVVLTTERLDEEQQGLKKCLQIFHDNKISKDNAWQLTLIDNMANLCRGHHKTLKNFQIVGTSLEATTKIYGLRVDSVHSDIVRMSSGLGRMKTDMPRHDDEDDDAANGDDIGNDGHQNGDGDPPQAKAPAKKKRVRKLVSTITKNKDTLNGRLELMQSPDALFYKLNSILGETSSSNKMILNMLETRQSQLSITMHDPFWETHSYEPIEFDENDNYDACELECAEFPMKPHIQPDCTLRQQMVGYAITNSPIDDDVEEERPQVTDSSFNISQYEYAFDMAADIEPIPPTENYAIDYDNLDYDGGNDFDDLAQDDRDAINACKGLRRKTTLITDMRPFDGSKLEYSYRPLDNINQFWAGPSYWKIRPKSRKLTMGRPSFADTDGERLSQASANAPLTIKRKAGNRNKAEMVKFVSMINSSVPDDSRIDSDDDDRTSFISIDSKAAQKFKKTNVYKRWDSKRLKLPTDLHIDRGLFSFYEFCPSAVIYKNDADSVTPVDDDDVYDTDNGDELHDCDDLMMADNMDVDCMGMDCAPDDAIDSFSQPISQLPDTQSTQIEGEISQTYEGAPQEIKRIDIQFARRAKVIDMKQMKRKCMETIDRQREKTSNRTITHPEARNDETYKDGAASFGLIYTTLPHVLTKTMAENLSPSIAFYSILHLANEHRFRLYKSTRENDMNVFLIRQLD